MSKESDHMALDEIRSQWRLMTVYERFEQFVAIMALLIAMEFKHSIVKVALRKESIIQVKAVILIAILALARKFIILEPDVDPAKVAALAGTVLALGLTYWLMRERDDRKSE